MSNGKHFDPSIVLVSSSSFSLFVEICIIFVCEYTTGNGNVALNPDFFSLSCFACFLSSILLSTLLLSYFSSLLSSLMEGLIPLSFAIIILAPKLQNDSPGIMLSILPSSLRLSPSFRKDSNGISDDDGVVVANELSSTSSLLDLL